VEIYNTAGPAIGGNIIWRMRIACWIPEARNTHSDYVINIGFPTPTTVARKRLISISHVLFQNSSHKINPHKLSRVFRCIISDKHHNEIR